MERAMAARGRDDGPGGAEAGTDRRQSQLVFPDDSFVFNRVSGHFYRLNRTAAFMVRALDNGHRADELPGLLRAEFGVDRETALRDAELFLNELAQLDLFADTDA